MAAQPRQLSISLAWPVAPASGAALGISQLAVRAYCVLLGVHNAVWLAGFFFPNACGNAGMRECGAGAGPQSDGRGGEGRVVVAKGMDGGGTRRAVCHRPPMTSGP